jgi:peptide/nickel transport system permease protein
MYRYLAGRMLAVIPVMFVVATIVFGLVYVSPTDPAAVIGGDFATPAQVAEIRAKLGLDEPLRVQYLHWLGSVLTGDLGTSIFSNQPVLDLILARAEPTLSLAVATMIFAVLLAVPVGIIAAWRAGTLVDRGVMMFAVAGISVPAFWTGYALIFLFAVKLRWFPVHGFVSLGDGIGPFLSHILLPSVTLGLAYAALLARVTRASMVEVLEQDFIRTARAKGLSTPAVLVNHALRVVAVPVVTMIGIGFAALVGGVVITESVFAIPGIGRLTVDSIQRKDIPVIQGVLLVTSGLYVVINLAVDMLYTLLDPRIRYES